MTQLTYDEAADQPVEHRLHRIGNWLPSDHRIHRAWLAKQIAYVDRNPTPLHPVILEFKNLIESSTRLSMLFTQMFQEMPRRAPYTLDPAGNRQIRDHLHMLKMLNHLLSSPPGWDDHEQRIGVVGVPFQVLFDWPMGTASGYSVFLDPEVNAMLKKVLNAWGEYLTSRDSRKCLGEDERGWFGEVGKRELTDVVNGATPDEKSREFEELFVCHPRKKYRGYKSWDDFFTRRFRFEDGIRPVASPHDDDVIANACESRTYKVGYNVQAQDRFWAKGQPYSVKDILDHDEWADEFVSGTIYQAFLSALSYHRWHSPVSGKIVKTKIIDGTYFSEPPYTGWQGKAGMDVEGQITGQGYLAAMATRGLIFIEADNPDIGLMCVIPIGMVEVSTCNITVKEGDHVKKGDELGMFHFGGSTHCLLFRKGVKIEGFPEPGSNNNVPVRGELARVSRAIPGHDRSSDLRLLARRMHV